MFWATVFWPDRFFEWRLSADKAAEAVQDTWELPKATWMVTVGSSMFKGTLEAQPRSLAGCGRMIVMAGTADTYNFDPTDHLVHLLQAKHADVRAVRFAGGHALPDEPLRRVLKELTALR